MTTVASALLGCSDVTPPDKSGTFFGQVAVLANGAPAWSPHGTQLAVGGHP